MVDSDPRGILQGENFKEIEDVIDARKRLGQYDVYMQGNPLNIRCVYSSFQKPQETMNRTVKFDEASFISTDNKDCLIAGVSGVRHTDSEITIVRIKCTGAAFKGKLNNKWDMNDIAIPGDGTHLGESPSLVNLATLVTQNLQCEGDDEYLVPLSSWDPFIKSDELQPDMKSCSDSNIYGKYSVRASYTEPNIPCRVDSSSGSIQNEIDSDEIVLQARRPSWAGKISKFWRQRWRKTKPLDEPEATDDVAGKEQNNKRI